MGIDDFTSVLKSHGIINIARTAFITLPQSHAFATWTRSQRTAIGADEYAMYWEVTYEVRIFYRDGRKTADVEMEKAIEQVLREFSGLTSEDGFNGEDNFDVTLYKFTTTEEF